VTSGPAGAVVAVIHRVSVSPHRSLAISSAALLVVSLDLGALVLLPPFIAALVVAGMSFAALGLIASIHLYRPAPPELSSYQVSTTPGGRSVGRHRKGTLVVQARSLPEVPTTVE
jgi:hypothetical protein